MQERILNDSGGFVRAAFHRQLPAAMLSVAGVMAGTMANSLIAGNLLGAGALAVMGVVSPIYSAFAAVGSLVGVGGTSLTAWQVGRGDREGANAAFTLSLGLCLGLSLLAALSGLALLDPLLALLGAQGALVGEARAYAVCMLLGGVGVAGIYLPYFFLKLEGRLRLSAGLFAALGVLNVGLDLSFVLVLDLGVAGVGLGTAAGNLLTAAAGWACLLGKGSGFRLCRLDGWRRAGCRLLRAGSPAGLNNLCGVLRTLALNRLLLPLAGAAGLSAFSVVSTTWSLSLIAVNGLAQTTVPFVGVFSGERDLSSLRQLERRAMGEGIAMVLPLAAALILLRTPYCALFGVTGEAITAAGPAVALFALSLLPGVVGSLLTNYYQAAGFTWLANLLTACRALVLVVLPAAALSGVLGAGAVWISFALGEALSLLLLAALLPLCRRGKPWLRGVLLLDGRYEENGRYLSFSVPSSVEAITGAAERISGFCTANGLDGRRSMMLSLALEEMLVSIKEHCCPEEETRDMSIRILIAGREGEKSTVVLRIRCSGAPFNPLEYYAFRRSRAGEAEGALSAEGLEALGDSLGIAMILANASSVDYQSTFGVNNLSILL